MAPLTGATAMLTSLFWARIYHLEGNATCLSPTFAPVLILAAAGLIAACFDYAQRRVVPRSPTTPASGRAG